jgi:antitoxin (DNA-binding transcriptional repressor) of toxin-antitoxin stability system
MRQVSLREFRIRGSKALESVPKGETILLAGQQGPAYFLVPVMEDIAEQDRDLRRALARASLRESWREAEALGLHHMTDEEINTEIDRARAERKRRRAG